MISDFLHTGLLVFSLFIIYRRFRQDQFYSLYISFHKLCKYTNINYVDLTGIRQKTSNSLISFIMKVIQSSTQVFLSFVFVRYIPIFSVNIQRISLRMLGQLDKTLNFCLTYFTKFSVKLYFYKAAFKNQIFCRFGGFLYIIRRQLSFQFLEISCLR